MRGLRISEAYIFRAGTISKLHVVYVDAYAAEDTLIVQLLIQSYNTFYFHLLEALNEVLGWKTISIALCRRGQG